MQLLVATRNPGKCREFAVLLQPILPPGTVVTDVGSWPTNVAEVVEDGETFVANALKKALQTARETGVTCLADDSGLEVDALDGRPGVYSARFAGEDATDLQNNAHLIRALRDVPPDARSARYVAVVAICLGDDELGRALRPAAERTSAESFVDGDHLLLWARGVCSGRIVDDPLGDAGFGYDPHFFIDDWGQTMAEVSLAKKNERSHRAAAVRMLAARLS